MKALGLGRFSQRKRLVPYLLFAPVDIVTLADFTRLGTLWLPQRAGIANFGLAFVPLLIDLESSRRFYLRAITPL
ncbi:hypothetical protein WL16_04815 [Burkholderia ubonensis]|nr:hypothetical protein WL16_04815 [Burkholderia ubonensis]